MATNYPQENDPRRAHPAPDLRRVTCARCGANNFPSSPVCWQCGTPQAGANGMPSSSAGHYSAQPDFVMPGVPPAWPDRYPAYDFVPPRIVDHALAERAAGFLGLAFPYIALPVGIVFLMLDDPRKTRLGWITIGWSAIGTVLSIILTILAAAPIWAVLKDFMPKGGGGLPGGSGLPGLPGGGLPGLPGGGGNGIPELQMWPFRIF